MSALRSGVVESLSLGQAELGRIHWFHSVEESRDGSRQFSSVTLRIRGPFGAVAKRPFRRGASTTDRAGKRPPELMTIGGRIER
jgi:hypothetical protein